MVPSESSGREENPFVLCNESALSGRRSVQAPSHFECSCSFGQRPRAAHRQATPALPVSGQTAAPESRHVTEIRNVRTSASDGEDVTTVGTRELNSLREVVRQKKKGLNEEFCSSEQSKSQPSPRVPSLSSPASPRTCPKEPGSAVTRRSEQARGASARIWRVWGGRR